LNPICYAIPPWTRNSSRKKWTIFWSKCNAMTNEGHNMGLPGEELVKKGLADLSQERMTDCSLLVLIAAPRLRRLGIMIPDRPLPRPYEHELYARLDKRLGPACRRRADSSQAADFLTILLVWQISLYNRPTCNLGKTKRSHVF
jgi:hypothetical protein